jgi:hypothetical protein
MADIRSTTVGSTTVGANYQVAAPGGFYSYQPTFVTIVCATATYDFVTNYSNASSNFAAVVRAIETVASPVILGTPAAASSNSNLTVVVDGATFNTGAGKTTSGSYGALKDALASATGVAASSFTIGTVALSGITLA